MKIITFGTLKGGVGKTMLCFNIAGVLAAQGYRILMVDSDLQGNLTNNLGIDRTDPRLLTMYDIYNTDSGQPDPKALILREPNKNVPGLDIIAGSLFLHRAELWLAMITGREQIFKNYIEDHRGFFGQYDYILIDTNPSMSVVNQNAFLVSDSILLVSDVSMNALEGAQLFIALWEESRKRLRAVDNVKGFIINDFDARTKIAWDFLEYLKTAEDIDDIRAIMMETVIPRNVRITDSELAALPITLFDPGSKGSLAITALTKELADKGII